MLQQASNKIIVLILLLFVLNGCSINSNAEAMQPSKVENIMINSKSLQKDLSANVYLPPDYNENQQYPVLYLLHGKDGNHNSWFNGFFGISAARINDKADLLISENKIMPLIIVCPMIDNSYGVNSSSISKRIDDHDEGMYEDYFINELIPYIDRNYSTIQDRSGRYIGGLSMGGFAALHLGFAHEDLFSKIGGHSAALRIDEHEGSDISWIFKNDSIRTQLDPLYQVERLKNLPLKVYLDHGDMDHEWLKRGNTMLYDSLKEKNVSVIYKVSKGGHNYSYWSNNTEKYLLFYSSN